MSNDLVVQLGARLDQSDCSFGSGIGASNSPLHSLLVPAVLVEP
jgi:hypothetical protein